MQYTVWSRGEIIGTTNLGFEALGAEQSRAGDFFPNTRGQELMDDLAARSRCMRAYMLRHYRDEGQESVIEPGFNQSSMFGDIAEHLHRCAHYRLELRDESDLIVSTSEIGIQDNESELPEQSQEEHEELSKQVTARIRQEIDDLRSMVEQRVQEEYERAAQSGDYVRMEEIQAAREEFLNGPGSEESSMPTANADWKNDDDDCGGDSGCKELLHGAVESPRYQIHVILAR